MTGYWFIDQQKEKENSGNIKEQLKNTLLKMVDTSDYWKIDYEGACQNIHNFKINNYK